MNRADQTHPLADEWLMDFAAGTLPPAYAAVAETYVSMTKDAEDVLAPFEAMGGKALEDREGVAMSVSATDLLARAGETPAPAPEPAAHEDYMPEGLCDFLDRTGTKVKWTWLGPGLRKALLWKGADDDRLWLIKAEPGVEIPHHTHQGSELTLILKGGFTSEGQHYGVGDVEEADDDVAHTIAIDEDSECVCLAATKGTLVFDSLVVKALQRFIGM